MIRVPKNPLLTTFLQGKEILINFGSVVRVGRFRCTHNVFPHKHMHSDFFTVGTLLGHNWIDRPQTDEQLKHRIIQNITRHIQTL